MNRPLASPPLNLATMAKPKASGRSLFWPLALALLAVVILAESQFDWGRMIRNQTEAPVGGAQADFDFTSGGRIDRQSDYSDYLGAPIFLASREPIFLPDPGRASATPARPGDFGLALLGTILSEDEPIAMMKTMPDGDVVRLRRDEQLGGWTLTEIEGRLVRLQRAGEIIELYLDPDNGAGENRPGR